MESDKKPEDKKPEDAKPADPNALGENPEGTPPHNALDTPTEDQAGADEVVDATSPGDKKKIEDAKPAKKPSALKKFFKRFNVYFLGFILIIVVGGAIVVVSYLNGKKPAPNISVNSQALSQDQLKQLANSNATVGGSGQTLTVQGNAVFSGQVLVRSNLDVAGTIQLGGAFSIPQLTVSGSSNLNTAQINNLQVAQAAVFQNAPTFQNGMNVSGNSSFTGNVSIGSLTLTNLIMSGNAQLQVPNHVAFTGASPGRTIDFNVLGGGGSASVFGSDVSGTVTVNTGNNPVAGCFVDLRFDVPFKNTPNVIIGPINQAAGETQFYATRTTTDFHICTANAAPANQAFAYSYFVTGT